MTLVSLWVGTSGYNYPEWRGNFYPEKFAAAKMLAYYAERFSTVEINYTFYRSPNAKILEGWDRETPPRFKLTLKAPKRITHDARLRDEGYTPQDIRRWGQTIAAHTGHCRDVFVYFKHEESGKGPAFARMLLDSLAAPGEANG